MPPPRRDPIVATGGDITPDALDMLIEASGGYPYFLQEFGKAIWNAAANNPFDTDDAELAVDVGRRHLDDGFFPPAGPAPPTENAATSPPSPTPAKNTPDPDKSPNEWDRPPPPSATSATPP